MKLAPALLLLASLAAADVRLPKYAREVLPNGVIVDVMPKPEVPLVSIRVVVRGGRESEPANRAGLADVTAEALRRGTAKRTAEQFSAELDALGATFDSSTDAQAAHVEIETLSKDFDAGLDLLLDALLRPTFPEAEIKKLVAQRIDAVKSLKDNPDTAAAMYYANHFFGSQHPYGRIADEASLARLTRNVIADYHKRMYVGRNLIVVVAGDIDPASAMPKLTKLLATVSAGRAHSWQQPQPRSTDTTRVAIIDKPDATQTNIMVGMPGIDRTHPDRVALWLVNTMFGGRFTSILNDELRVNSGLTYGASSRFDPNHMPGRLTISTFTKTETTGKALDMAIALLKNLAQNGITAEQLASTKAYVKGMYPSTRLETADQLASILGEIELYDLTRAEVDDLFSRIDAVTPEQANQVARKYYGQGALTFLLLGNAAKFASEVKKYDANPITVPITRPGFQVRN